jgi:hypothetical protein
LQATGESRRIILGAAFANDDSRHAGGKVSLPISFAGDIGFTVLVFPLQTGETQIKTKLMFIGLANDDRTNGMLERFGQIFVGSDT